MYTFGKVHEPGEDYLGEVAYVASTCPFTVFDNLLEVLVHLKFIMCLGLSQDAKEPVW